MNTRDLLEMCQLDALGLLDDQERAAFDAAFMSAAQEVRAQLRREQARWVRTDLIGVAAEPPEGLRDAVLADVGVAAMRDRVLAAVHEEIERAGVPALAAVPAVAAIEHASGRSTPALRPVRRVSRLWRATALGFASATVALCATTLHLRDRFDSLHDEIRQEAELRALASIPGGTHDLLFNRSEFKMVVFTPTAAGFKGEASLDYAAKEGKGRLYCLNLPTDARKRYTLVALDASGERLLGPTGRPVVLCEAFASKGGLQVIQDVTFPTATARIALCEASDDSAGGVGREVMQVSLV